jgi:hypothetical protein
LSSEGVTEYQLICKWGEDARSKIIVDEVLDFDNQARAATNTLLSDNEGLGLINTLKSQELINCQDSGCNKLFVLSTTLVNNSESIIDGISLAIGLFWKDKDSSLELPGHYSDLEVNEDELSLGKLRLMPLESKRIRVRLDQSIPILSEGEFVPNVRILKAENLK